MSYSQKHAGKVFVPWFNSAEWRSVHQLLCADTVENSTRTLAVLKAWKRRTPLLSAGIEGTLIVLEALLTDVEGTGEDQLRQIYAVSLLRFLNVCAANSDRQGAFRRTAARNDLPKWLVDVRHDIAHDHRLPSRRLLELCLRQSLGWLKRKYWSAQLGSVEDYAATVEASDPPDGDEGDPVGDAVRLYLRAKLCSFGGKKGAKELLEEIDGRLGVGSGKAKGLDEATDVLEGLVRRSLEVKGDGEGEGVGSEICRCLIADGIFFRAELEDSGVSRVADGRSRASKVADRGNAVSNVADGRNRASRVAEAKNRASGVAEGRSGVSRVAEGRRGVLRVADGGNDVSKVAEGGDRVSRVAKAKNRALKGAEGRSGVSKVAEGGNGASRVAERGDRVSRVANDDNGVSRVAKSGNRVLRVAEAKNRASGVGEEKIGVLRFSEAKNRASGVAEGKFGVLGVAEVGNDVSKVAEGGNRVLRVAENKSGVLRVAEGGNGVLRVAESKSGVLRVAESGNRVLGVAEGGNRVLGVAEGGNDVFGVADGNNDVFGVAEGGNDVFGVAEGGNDVSKVAVGGDRVLRVADDNNGVLGVAEGGDRVSRVAEGGNRVSRVAEGRIGVPRVAEGKLGACEGWRIPKGFVKIWSGLLSVLYEKGFLFHFLDRLLDVTNNVMVEERRRRYAALWIGEICDGLRKLQRVEEEFEGIRKDNPHDLDSRTSKLILKTILDRKDPDLRDVLDLSPSIGLNESEAKVFQENVLNMLNEHSLCFLQKVLIFNKNDKEYIEETLKLAEKLISANRIFDESQFSSDDLAINNFEEILSGDLETESGIEKSNLGDGLTESEVVKESSKVSRWRKVEDTSLFENCPLGVLPHQSRDKNPVLSFPM